MGEMGWALVGPTKESFATGLFVLCSSCEWSGLGWVGVCTLDWGYVL